jgi:hypothetical protein
MRTINHLYRYSDGIELDCELEFEPGQTASEIDPPYPPAAYLISAKVGGVDILPLLGNDLIGQIEEGAIWSQD